MRAVLSLLLCSALLSAAPAEKPKLITLELTPAGGLDAATAAAMTDAVATEVKRAGVFDVVSARDVKTLIGLERQKELLGCNDAQAQSCLAELGGALGARFVMSGSVARLGASYQLSLMVLDSEKAQPVGRSTRIAKDLDAVRAALPWAIAEASGTPPPAPPSRLVPWTLIGAGTAVTLAGAVLGLDGIAREREVNRELQLGAQNREVLQPRSAYQDAASFASTEKTLALSALLAGAALVGSGVYLNTRIGPEVSASLVPSTSGFAVAGVFP